MASGSSSVPIGKTPCAARPRPGAVRRCALCPADAAAAGRAVQEHPEPAQSAVQAAVDPGGEPDASAERAAARQTRLDAARERLQGEDAPQLTDDQKARLEQLLSAGFAVRPELNPVEGVWSLLKRSLANLTKQNIDQLTVTVKARLKRVQYRPGLVDGLVAKTGLNLQPQPPQLNQDF
ncbi:hypothetical protein [Streptomyces sp. NPDC059460]|uniref:hypothetical protein n=1 Tax=Streptomyces sp. NPDC059460 TaxID=3346840 RepID=UPI0036C40E48